MPQNQFQRMVFALITVVITVHAYVFYSLYVVNGGALMAANGTGSVLEAIRMQGGVYMFGRMLPIWAVILIEFCFAYTLEILMGSPLSFRLASRIMDPSKNHPIIFESAIICATVGLMCLAMSFLAAWFYYPYYAEFHLLTLLANWLKLVCFNFPFAYFTQMFFIQPFVRVAFKTIFARQLKARREEYNKMAAEGEKLRPTNEPEAIADIFRRIEEIQEEIAHEHRRRKVLEAEVHEQIGKKNE